MSDPIVQRMHEWLKAHESQLLEETRRMLQIPSVKEDPSDGAPYGIANREALDYAFELGRATDMSTKDLDHKVGYAEWGKGDRLILVLGHLDVVPVGPGWKFPPFAATIDNGYIYARGATDDKGPTMAAFYASRALQAVCPDLNARIRVVFGCDEESGMTCVERYAQTEEMPTFGVAPDAGWPLIHAEKGICDLFIEAPVPQSEFTLVEIAGGQRLNIVIDSCSAKVRVSAKAKAHVAEKLGNSWDRNLTFNWESDEILVIEAIGKAAHGSTPFEGDSAAVRVLRLLKEIAPIQDQAFYEAMMYVGHPSGVGVGIHGRDDASKDLTTNLGVIAMNGKSIRFSVNVRYPVTWKGSQVQDMATAFMSEKPYGMKLVDFHDSPSLYFPLDHPLVKTIVEVYEAESGETGTKPGVMGGGTYARKIPNTVAIGTGWMGDGEAHQTDERLAIESLFKMSRIYAHVLYRLATIPA